jgi:hypothetical protein
MPSAPESSASQRASPARVLLVSLRRLNGHAAWCSNYEFEDVIGSVDDVDMLELDPAPRRALSQRLSRALAFRGLSTTFNPGVRPVELRHDYDLAVFICMNVWDLLYLNALRGWRTRCKVKVCYMVEFYAGQELDLAPLLRPLGHFDHLTQCFSSSVATVARASGRPCHHVPLAADVLRFTPYPVPPARVIDVLSLGRRSEPVHQGLLRDARERGHFYLHDTIPGPHVYPANPAEHRQMFANQAKRSRFFVTYPAKFGDGENQGLSEVGARFYEGAAAGAVLLGGAPTVPAFQDDFPWPDAVVEPHIDGSDVGAVVDSLLARPAELARLSVRNAVLALRRHDWAHRWKTLLGIAGLSPRPALGARLARLEALAGQAEHTGVAA